MKKITFSMLILLTCCLVAKAQSNEAKSPSSVDFLPLEYTDKCGNPASESMLWMSVEGTVIKVVDGDSVILLMKDKKQKRVDLAAVDASTSDENARRMLTELVLNQQVDVLVNPSKVKSKRVSGVVHTPGADVNRELIKAGAAKYKEPNSYSMSNYTACVYRITESEAREAKRGLWQNVVSR